MHEKIDEIALNWILCHDTAGMCARRSGLGGGCALHTHTGGGLHRIPVQIIVYTRNETGGST